MGFLIVQYDKKYFLLFWVCFNFILIKNESIKCFQDKLTTNKYCL